MHRVEADPELRDARALALLRLETRDPLAPLANGLAQPVELAMEAVADVAGLVCTPRATRHRRRVVDQRPAQRLRHLGHRLRQAQQGRRLAGRLREEVAAPFAQSLPHAGKRLERIPHGRQVARRRRRPCDLREQPLEVAYRPQRITQARTRTIPLGQERQRILARPDRLRRKQRIREPAGQAPRTEWRHRTVELLDQRAPASAVLGAAEELQVPQRRRVEHHGVREPVVA